MTTAAKKPVRHITTKNLPTSIRPRERLRDYGASKLSTAELIAIILGTGARGVTSTRLAEKIVEEFDQGAGRLGRLELEELSDIQGIGEAKASQILAAIELGRRVAQAKPSRRISLAAPAKVAELLMSRMRAYEREHFVALIVDAKIRLKKEVEVAVGGLSAAIIKPRDLYKQAIRANGSGLIVAHNHPSGEVAPSREDIVLTKRLMEAGKILGIDFHDHIIIGDGHWISLKEQGYLS